MRVLMLKNHTSPDGTRHQKGSVWHFSDEDAAKLIAGEAAEPKEPTAEEIAAFDAAAEAANAAPAASTDSADESHGAEHEEG